MDSVYHECMEILNRGRGAGKSHALALWQLEDPAKRRIVSHPYSSDLYTGLGVSRAHIWTYEQAVQGRLIGFTGAVGFDDFDKYIKNHIVNELHVDIFRSDDSTILVTNLLESDLLPGPTELPVNTDYAEKLKSYLQRNLPDAAAALGFGESGGPLLGVVTPEEDPVEPAPVAKRMDELCLGDHIEGRGIVTALRLHERDNSDFNEVSADLHDDGFTGTLRLRASRPVKVRPKK